MKKFNEFTGKDKFFIFSLLTIMLLVVVAAGCSQTKGGEAPKAANEAVNEGGSGEEVAEHGSETEVKVSIKEFSVTPEISTAQAGEVEFIVTNDGKELHEMEILQGVDVVDEVEDIKPGQTKELKVNLKPGTYQLVCRIVETEENGELEDHMKMGMTTDFVVTGEGEMSSEEMSESGSETEVNVSIKEFSVTPEVNTAPAGEVEFIVKNDGKELHEMEVMQGVDVIDEVEDVKPGETKELKVNLKPGTYQLVCRIVETEPNGELEDHLKMGMTSDFTVK